MLKQNILETEQEPVATETTQLPVQESTGQPVQDGTPRMSPERFAKVQKRHERAMNYGPQIIERFCNSQEKFVGRNLQSIQSGTQAMLTLWSKFIPSFFQIINAENRTD